MMKDLIIVRGAGDIATGIIHALKKANFNVLALETERPTAIRRRVSFCEAVYDGSVTVENITLRLARNLKECEELLEKYGAAVFVDKEARTSIDYFKPVAVVDAILAKKNLGTRKDFAKIVIGVGPGFVAGEDVDLVIETMRGHNLGRIIENGSALPNTGIPGDIAGFSKERVIHAPSSGRIKIVKDIGARVEKEDIIATITTDDGDRVDVLASIKGLIRGMIRDDFYVKKGLKMADIDPRNLDDSATYTISDKARNIGGSVLVAIMSRLSKD